MGRDRARRNQLVPVPQRFDASMLKESSITVMKYRDTTIMGNSSVVVVGGNSSRSLLKRRAHHDYCYMAAVWLGETPVWGEG